MAQKSLTVYVVDDDESVRRALGRLLRSCGYHAVTFRSAEGFMEATSCQGEGCLVLDIRLPGMTGLDLQEKLSLTGAKHAVIFMTAHDNPEWQQRAKKAGAVAYLRKPFPEQSRLVPGHRHFLHRLQFQLGVLTCGELSGWELTKKGEASLVVATGALEYLDQAKRRPF
jgi:DNA-binding NtrC family response regulator